MRGVSYRDGKQYVDDNVVMLKAVKQHFGYGIQKLNNDENGRVKYYTWDGCIGCTERGMDTIWDIDKLALWVKESEKAAIYNAKKVEAEKAAEKVIDPEKDKVMDDIFA